MLLSTVDLLVVTSLGQPLFLMSNTIYASYLNEEVICPEHFLSVSFPCNPKSGHKIESVYMPLLEVLPGPLLTNFERNNIWVEPRNKKE
jgi:hypothetical protein